jgi:uncharacterized membrane protein YsdA (DUF1294 family)/cold shock CspA family protein
VAPLGKVLEWNDAKGYGFIHPIDGGAAAGRVFFHIRDYERGGRRPEIGELVRFVPGGEPGRPRAQSVRRAVPSARSSSRSVPPATARRHTRELPGMVALMLIVGYGAGMAWAVSNGRLPLAAGFSAALLNAITYVTYALDKHAAQHGGRRIPESSLHGLELLGGWPGALLAQRVMRHKTRKIPYRIAFWAAVAVNCAALGWWLLLRT